MLKAAIYGFVASGALLIGAFVAVLLSGLPERDQRTVEKVNKVIMAFGAGVLICTLSFELMEEAFQKGGFDDATIGFLVGAMLFVVGDFWLDRKGSGWEMLLGALLDGIPETAVVGIGLLAGKGLGLLMMIAVFLSNLPEGLAGARSMMNPDNGERKKYSSKETLVLWGAVTLVCTSASVAGYGFFGNASDSAIARMLAIAAGAILAMVAHTMIPEAFRSLPKRADAGAMPRRRRVFRIYDKIEAMATVAGFLVTFILSRLTA